MNGVNYYITDQEIFINKVFKIGYNDKILSESQVYDYLNEMKHIKRYFHLTIFKLMYLVKMFILMKLL